MAWQSGEQAGVSEQRSAYVFPGVNQEDLSRNFSLPAGTIFKWFQSARMRLPWVGAGYSKLSAEEPPANRRLLVKLQAFRMEPGALDSAAEQVVSSVVSVGAVGGTSIEFRYQVLYGDRVVGDGVVLMVCVEGEPGKMKPAPVPARIKALAASDGNRAGLTDKAFAIAELKRVPRSPPARGDMSFAYDLIVRYSDEDVNKHANHSAYARFCEDALETLRASCDHPLCRLLDLAGGYGQKRLAGVLLEYAAEGRVGDALQVCLSRSSDAPSVTEAIVDVHILRDTQLLVRGQLVLRGMPPQHSVSRL